MASFNLLHSSIGAVITCNKPAVDGHDVENLLSSSDYETPFGRGFLAESFIRPPVDVIIKFPFNVEIEKIVMDTKIGSQRSSGFEIYGSSNQLPRSDNSSRNGADETIYSFMGRGFSSSSHIFCFRNKTFNLGHYYSKLPQASSILLSANLKNVSEFELIHKYPSPVRNLNCLTVRIQRVASGSACSLKVLELWGKPSRFVKRLEVDRFLMNYCKSQHQTNSDLNFRAEKAADAPEMNTNRESCDTKRVCDASTAAEQNIPEEFLDPITQEILVLPMLLPSGQTVDLSTLERHKKEEEKWGRLPADPFTGKTFTQASSPLPNTALKLRIDEYLMQHPKIITSRTVGRGEYSNIDSGSKVSKLVTARKCKEETTHSNQISLKRKSSALYSASQAGGDLPESGGLSFPIPKRIHTSNSAVKTVDSDTLCTNSSVMDGERYGQKISDDLHVRRLTSSLDTALSNTLANLPSFRGSNVKKRNEGSTNEMQLSKKCLECGNVSDIGMYKLKCPHVLCRDCLIKTCREAYKCPLDQVCSLRSDVLKIHIN